VVVVDPGGKVKLYLGMQDNGQGHATAQTQILSQRLGIDAASIEVIQGDTDATPDGMTGGSRFAPTGGVTVMEAVDKVIEKGRDLAAAALEVAATDVEYGEGRFVVAGTDKALSLFEVAAAAQQRSGAAKGGVPTFEVKVTRGLAAATYPNGCHIVEVEIDQDTGQVSVQRYHAVDDFGSVINPNLLAGQVHGGITQGLGQALLEHTVYEAGSGQLLSASFMDYAIPRADDVPSFVISTHNSPCTTNPLGIKGAGEAGAIGAPPALVNAVVDALHEATGLTHIDMPVLAERVWRVLHAGKAA
jgi:carbon-monoxide dehydrogenase large subunit